VQYNNNTSSGHIRKPKKACQHSQYAEERKEASWLARLADYNMKNPPRRVG